jgi:hypothetical protein
VRVSARAGTTTPASKTITRAVTAPRELARRA